MLARRRILTTVKRPAAILVCHSTAKVAPAGPGRYIWLPLWVLPLPASEPGPPVDVVVRWHDSWHATDFARPPRPRKVRFARPAAPPPPSGLFSRRGTPP